MLCFDTETSRPELNLELSVTQPHAEGWPGRLTKYYVHYATDVPVSKHFIRSDLKKGLLSDRRQATGQTEQRQGDDLEEKATQQLQTRPGCCSAEIPQGQRHLCCDRNCLVSGNDESDTFARNRGISACRCREHLLLLLLDADMWHDLDVL
jgi:hypothetical protein